MTDWREGPWLGLLLLFGALLLLAGFVFAGSRWLAHEEVQPSTPAHRQSASAEPSTEFAPSPAAEAATRLAEEPASILQRVELKPLGLYPFLGQVSGPAPSAPGHWVAVDLLAEQLRVAGKPFEGLQVDQFLLTDPRDGHQYEPRALVPLDVSGNPSAQPAFTGSRSRVLLLYWVSEDLTRATVSYWPERLTDLLLRPPHSPAAAHSKALVANQLP